MNQQRRAEARGLKLSEEVPVTIMVKDSEKKDLGAGGLGTRSAQSIEEKTTVHSQQHLSYDASNINQSPQKNDYTQ